MYLLHKHVGWAHGNLYITISPPLPSQFTSQSCRKEFRILKPLYIPEGVTSILENAHKTEVSNLRFCDILSQPWYGSMTNVCRMSKAKIYIKNPLEMLDIHILWFHLLCNSHSWTLPYWEYFDIPGGSLVEMQHWRHRHIKEKHLDGYTLEYSHQSSQNYVRIQVRLQKMWCKVCM